MNFLEILNIEVDKKPVSNLTDNILIGNFVFKGKYDKFYTDKFNKFFDGRFAPIKSFFSEREDIKSLYRNSDKDIMDFIKFLKLESDLLRYIVESGDLKLYSNSEGYKDENYEDFYFSNVSIIENEYIKLEIVDKNFKKFFLTK